MKSPYACLVGIVLTLLLSGCASTPQRPTWINNPGNGVSASAGTHVRGRVAQEELAISRARTEYAKRFGVSIEAGQIYQTSTHNDRSSTVGESVEVEKMSQNDVKAMVKAKWLDEDSDVLWVWLVPSN